MLSESRCSVSGFYFFPKKVFIENESTPRVFLSKEFIFRAAFFERVPLISFHLVGVFFKTESCLMLYLSLEHSFSKKFGAILLLIPTIR